MPDTTPTGTLSAFTRSTTGLSTSYSGSVASASAGLSSGSVSSTVTQTSTGFNYALIIQVPVPSLNFKLNISPSWVLSKINVPKMPAALKSMISEAESDFQKVVDVAVKLIRAVPELTISILVKVGPVTVFNVQLVAKKVPVEIALPNFVLDLPSIAFAAGIDLSSLIPAPDPSIIQVPIPVPSVSGLNVGVTGGNVSADAAVFSSSYKDLSTSTSGDATNKPVSISNPVKLPII